MSGRNAPGTGIVCCAKGCTATGPRPFCQFHWELVPKPLKTEWYHRDPTANHVPLLSRMIAAVERAQFGERLL